MPKTVLENILVEKRLSTGRLKMLLALSVSCAALNSAPVLAQTSTNAAAASSNSQIQEIVVTANRRRENIQVVPIAVQAFSAAAAAKEGITSPESLPELIPGFTDASNGTKTIPYLRGVGSLAALPGDEGSVAMYVDDVYIPSAEAQINNFNSLDRIEVEKGPQGTLFGRNADGGVIQVFTKDPSRTPEADVSLGYANYNTRSASVYASTPITSTLAANVAIYGSHQYSGWGTNTTTGASIFKGWDYGGRIKVLWTPDDDTSALLSVDHDMNSPVENTAYIGVQGRLLGAAGLAIPGVTGLAPPGGYYNSSDNQPGETRINQSGVSLKVTHDFDWARLVSITAYRDTIELPEQGDPDAGPVDWFYFSIYESERTETQELQLLSPKGSALTWIAGLFYYNDIAGDNHGRYSGIFFPDNPVYSSQMYTDSYAGFGQATATVLPDTHLTVGLRYTEDERTIFGQWQLGGVAGYPYLQGNDANSGVSAKSQRVTWRFALDHQFTPNIMGYIADNRGFKSGAFNAETGTPAYPVAPAAAVSPTISPAVAPEILDAYTVGEKAEFFDHRLRINTEAFYYQYKNIQLNIVAPSGTEELTNATSADIDGIDLDVQAKPIERLTLTASAEVLDGHYGHLPSAPAFIYSPNGGNISVNTNQSGNRAVFTPPFSMNAAANYVVPLSKWGSVDLNVSVSHTGRYSYQTFDDGGYDIQKVLNLVNASTTWTSENDKWGVQLWAKNITNQKYWTFSQDDVFASFYAPAPPATYGVTVSYHFGG